MRKVTRYLPTPGPEKQAKSRPFTGIILALIAFGMALGVTVRVSALPAEARVQETWYAYHQELKYDFRAHVQAGSVYGRPVMESADLYQMKLAMEPPAYRRALVGKLTDSVEVQLPFVFTGDRTAPISVSYSVDGMLSAPGFWQKPYPLITPQTLQVNGSTVDLQELAVKIPVKQLLADIEKLQKELNMNFDPIELRIRPRFEVQVANLREPVATRVNPEIVMTFRGGDAVVEIDEPKVAKEEKELSITYVTRNTVPVFGWNVPIATLQRVSFTLLAVLSALLLGGLLLKWLRASKANADLQKIGSALIVAKGFELPADATVVDVGSPQQLVALHLQTDRPVIRVGEIYYLLDGTTCYRLVMGQKASAGDDQGA